MGCLLYCPVKHFFFFLCGNFQRAQDVAKRGKTSKKKNQGVCAAAETRWSFQKNFKTTRAKKQKKLQFLLQLDLEAMVLSSPELDEFFSSLDSTSREGVVGVAGGVASGGWAGRLAAGRSSLAAAAAGVRREEDGLAGVREARGRNREEARRLEAEAAGAEATRRAAEDEAAGAKERGDDRRRQLEEMRAGVTGRRDHLEGRKRGMEDYCNKCRWGKRRREGGGGGGGGGGGERGGGGGGGRGGEGERGGGGGRGGGGERGGGGGMCKRKREREREREREQCSGNFSFAIRESGGFFL